MLKLTKNQKVVAGVIVFLLVALVAGASFYFWQKNKLPSSSKTPELSLELTKKAEDLLSQGKYEECEKLSQQAVDLDKNNIEAIILLARSKYAQGKLTEAKDVYLKGLEKDPENFKMNFYVAHIFRDLGEFELAKKHYKKAAEINPYDIMVWHNYAASYGLDQGDWEGAVKIYEEALKYNPDDEFLTRQYEIAKQNAGTK